MKSTNCESCGVAVTSEDERDTGLCLGCNHPQRFREYGMAAQKLRLSGFFRSKEILKNIQGYDDFVTWADNSGMDETQRIKSAESWGWDSLKAELGHQSWKTVPPMRLYEWAINKNLTRFLPSEYKPDLGGDE